MEHASPSSVRLFFQQALHSFFSPYLLALSYLDGIRAFWLRRLPEGPVEARLCTVLVCAEAWAGGQGVGGKIGGQARSGGASLKVSLRCESSFQAPRVTGGSSMMYRVSSVVSDDVARAQASRCCVCVSSTPNFTDHGVSVCFSNTMAQ